MIGFGQYGKERKKVIDEDCLVTIDPSAEGFFDFILEFKTDNQLIQSFLDAVKEVSEANVGAFSVPTLYPILDGGCIMFQSYNWYERNMPFNWWAKMAKRLREVDGRQWSVGTEYQYYSLLVFFIKETIELNYDYSLEDAIKLVLNPKLFCEKVIFKDANKNIILSENTMRIMINIGKVGQMIASTNINSPGHWITQNVRERNGSLADISFSCDDDIRSFKGPAWLVINQ